MTEIQQTMADRFSSLAGEMIDFILKSHYSIREQNKHIAELASIMKEIEDEYHQPMLTVWSMQYRIYRQYKKVHVHASSHPELFEQLLILKVMTYFLNQTSKDDSDTNNLMLLDLLLVKINQFKILTIDKKLLFASKKVKEEVLFNIRMALRNAFIYQAQKILSKLNKPIDQDINVIYFNLLKK